MLRQFLIILFAENERLGLLYQHEPKQVTKPFTDEELESLVRKHFANDPTVLAAMDNLPPTGSNNRIRIWRSEHNRGLWTVKPTYRSFRYGDEGVPVNRNGNQLSGAEIADAILSFPFDDPRKVDYMLVLSRKVDEVIKIGDDIEVHIVRIGPNNVRVGVIAPRHISILREELADASNPTTDAGTGLRS